MTRRGTLLLASKGRGRGQQEIQQVTYQLLALHLFFYITNTLIMGLPLLILSPTRESYC